MEQKRKLLLELGVVALFFGWWFFFVASNVDATLGEIYIGLTLGAGLMALIDNSLDKKELELVNPNNSWIAAITIAVVGYFVIIFGGQLVVKLVSGVPLVDVLKLLQSSAPVFSNSKIINDLTFGFFVAYIETYAIFVVGYDLLASMFKVSISKQGLRSIKIWLIIIGLTAFFTILHATAKALDQSSLVVVAFMGLISLIIITITKEGRTGILTHIIANSVAVFFGG